MCKFYNYTLNTVSFPDITTQIDYFEKTMELIDNTLETVKSDKYYRIIELKYFNKNLSFLCITYTIGQNFDSDRN